MTSTLTGVAPLVGGRAAKQKVTGLVPSQVMYKRQPINVSLPLFFPFPLSKNKYIKSFF